MILENRAKQRQILVALLAALEDPAAVVRWPGDGDADAGLWLEVARHHRLTPLVSAVCGDRLTGDLAAACRKDRLITAARNMLLVHATKEGLKAFRAAEVPVIVLKGIAYEHALYSPDGARPTADIDLLVPADKRRAAFDVLDRLGYEPRAAAPGFDDADYHEVAWRRDDVEVDLHMALAPVVRCRIDYDDVWRSAPAIEIEGTAVKILDARHAAVFHALHMAIDHFDVPALYLVDFARLLPSEVDLGHAEAVARAWGLRRPFATALALAEAFLPAWRAGHARRPAPWFARRIADHYGSIERLARPAQIARKMIHFDEPITALRYTVVQARRHAHELIETRIRRRGARERLSLVSR